VETFVINLDRRQDRLDSITHSLALRGLPFTRVSAVDAANPDFVVDDRLTQRPFGAIWASHVKAYETFLNTDANYALILEDDAHFRSGLDWQPLIQSLPHAMDESQLHYLQIGFITEQYKPRRMPNWLDEARQKRRAQHFPVQLGPSTETVILWSSRAGSHAYVISRYLAEVVTDFNSPPWLAPDGFYGYLAQAQGVFNIHRMGRLATSLIDQASRVPGSVAVDSDAVV
jgi:GR25 family glycosyltransferase involved in LPS biosynthesis